MRWGLLRHCCIFLIRTVAGFIERLPLVTSELIERYGVPNGGRGATDHGIYTPYGETVYCLATIQANCTEYKLAN